MKKLLFVLFVSSVMAGCGGIAVYPPGYVTPMYQTPVAKVCDASGWSCYPVYAPAPPVLYIQVSCNAPGYWAWAGDQRVCVYPSAGTTFYGTGFYWTNNVWIFRSGPAEYWRYNRGRWDHDRDHDHDRRRH